MTDQLQEAVKLAKTAARLMMLVMLFAATIVAASAIRSCSESECPPCTRTHVLTIDPADHVLPGSAEYAP